MARRGNTVLGISLADALPTFQGNPDENVNFYIQQIEEVSALENWSE